MDCADIITYFLLAPDSASKQCRVFNYFYNHKYLHFDQIVPYPFNSSYTEQHWQTTFIGSSDNPKLHSILQKDNSILLGLAIPPSAVLTTSYHFLWCSIIQNYFSVETAFVQAISINNQSLQLH